MAKYAFVNFEVETQRSCDEIYICGSTHNLGGWDAAKAVVMNKVTPNKFTLRKRFNAGEVVEYKVLYAPDWQYVEKGMYGEEVANHTVTAGNDAYVMVYESR